MKISLLANKDEIIIDKEFKTLLPKLTDEQYSLLERDIVENGCRMPLVYWDYDGKKILIGGHNRLAICRQHDIDFRIVTAPEVQNRVEAKIWIIKEQLGQRNLDPLIRIKLALALKDLYAEMASRNRSHGLTGPGKTLRQNSDKAFEPLTTNKKLAEIAGVSHDTIARSDYISKNASSEQLKRLEEGKATINKIYKELKKEPRELSSEIQVLSAKFKWAITRGVIPTGTKLKASLNILREGEKGEIANLLLELEKLLKEMLAEINGSNSI